MEKGEIIGLKANEKLKYCLKLKRGYEGVYYEES